METMKTDFKCNICGTTRTTKGSLNAHMKDLHANNRIENKCHICWKTFSTDSLVYEHVRQVHDETIAKPRCELCDKEIANKNKLKTVSQSSIHC